MMTRQTVGSFIREKVSRGLHKTQTPRIHGTKSMFTAYPGRGVLGWAHPSRGLPWT